MDRETLNRAKSLEKEIEEITADIEAWRESRCRIYLRRKRTGSPTFIPLKSLDTEAFETFRKAQIKELEIKLRKYQKWFEEL